MRYSGLIDGFVVGSLALLSGCTVLPHNDVMLFGTDSQVAVDVSANPEQNSVPHITIGYKRREFVWMPLFPNGQYSFVAARGSNMLVASAGSEIIAPAGKDISLKPGKMEMVPPDTRVTLSDGAEIKFSNGTQILVPATQQDVTVPKGQKRDLPSGSVVALVQGSMLSTPGELPSVDISSPKYVGVGPGRERGTESDTYSVLASFGGDIKAGATTAGVGIAQFFATGIAARRLAEEGGARLVSIQPPEAGSEEIQKLAAERLASQYNEIERILNYVEDMTSKGKVNGEQLSKLTPDTGLGADWVKKFDKADLSQLKNALLVRYRSSVDALAKNLPAR
jgi:hypothetical protein